MIAPRRASAGYIAAALLVCSGTTQATPDEPPPQLQSPIAVPESTLLPATLPFQDTAIQWGKIPIVTISLEASRQERAAIATGLNAIVVSPETSARLKLATVDGRVKVDALNTSTMASQAEVKSLRSSTLDLPRLVFAVADVPAMLSPHPPLDAPAFWLGTPFLSAFQMTLDPKTKSVILNKSTAPLVQGRGASVVPLIVRDHRPYVQVSIPGAKSFVALIDTCSPGTVIPTAAGEQLKIKPVSVVSFSRIDGKPAKAAFIDVPRFSVGKAEWKSGRVAYLTSESSKEYDRTFAVIGMDFISKFKLTIDYARSKVSLSPPEMETKSPASDTAGQ